MTAQDSLAFTRLIAKFDLAYPRAPISEEAIAAVYFPVLADLTLDEVRVGIDRWIRGDHAFPPAPGELRAAALGTTDQRGALAWARIKRAVLDGYGGYRPLDFGDPVLHAAVIAMGGWGQLHSLGYRDTEGVDWATARKEFLALYAAYATLGAPADTPRALPAAAPHADYTAPLEVPRALTAVRRTPVAALPEAMPQATVDFTANMPGVRALLDDVTKRMAVATAPRRAPLAKARAAFAPVSEQERAEHRERLAHARRQIEQGGEPDR